MRALGENGDGNGGGAAQRLTRRRFLADAGGGLGALLGPSLLGTSLLGSGSLRAAPAAAGASGGIAAGCAAGGGVHAAVRHAATARRVIFLFMSGGPSQLDLFDHKPKLNAMHGQPMPESVTRGQRVAQLRGRDLVVAGSRYAFRRHGESGAEVSELLPHTASIVDHIAIVRSLHSDAINHDPGMTLMQTGAEQPGRPSMGAWVSFALGSANPGLPAHVVLVSGGGNGAQPLYSRLWSAAFLPGRHQGVRMRSTAEPVLFLADPPGVDRAARRALLDAVQRLNQLELEAVGDPEIATRSEAYELAFRMQTTVPELTELAAEPRSVLDLYGVQPGKPSFATNCLIARRMAERGVRFIQLYHRDWDHHENLPHRIDEVCRETDRACAALVLDLKRRGLLDDTLVIWGGEFGRSPMNQGSMSEGNYGRDHHGSAFTMWLAGGGIASGVAVGATDELGYHAVEDPVHINDLHATVLHCLGIDHELLTWRHEGRDFRLTDVAGKVVRKLLA